MEIKDVKIKDLKPAAYNPRKCSKEQMEHIIDRMMKLDESLVIKINGEIQ